jgi:hypothetical protein
MAGTLVELDHISYSFPNSVSDRPDCEVIEMKYLKLPLLPNGLMRAAMYYPYLRVGVHPVNAEGVPGVPLFSVH